LTLVGCTKESYVEEITPNPVVDPVTEDTSVEVFTNSFEHGEEVVSSSVSHDRTFVFTVYGNFGSATIVETPTVQDTIWAWTGGVNVVIDTTFSYTIGPGEYIDVLCSGPSCFIELDVTVDDEDMFTVYDDDLNSSVTYFYQN
jgi:hypothetical protein